jgi:hypothetical protein
VEVSSGEYLDNGLKLDPEMFYGWWRRFVVKSFRLKMMMTVFRGKKSLQIPVPAVAVKQEGQALFIIIGRKG